MADSQGEMSPIMKKKRARGTNFTCSEISVLFSEYRQVKTSLEGTKVPNQVKNKLWEAIASKVSGAGTAFRTAKEVKTKWANLSRVSKNTNSQYKMSFGKTGGGPPMASPKGLIRDIIDLNEESETFNGIAGGVETEICTVKTDTHVKRVDQKKCQKEHSPLNQENKLTVSDGIEVIHPADVDVEIIKDVKATGEASLHRQKTEQIANPKKKRQRVTQEMVWEAQIRYFEEQTISEIRRRELMNVKEDFYKAATTALENANTNSMDQILDLLHPVKEV